MFIIWVFFHILVCVGLVLVVLMQSSKGEGLAGTALGGGGGMAGAVFGGRGAASFLSRATTVLAVVFMLNCGTLAFMSASNKVTFPGTSPTNAPTTSAVTREAQKERDRYLQQQQRQALDSAAQTPFQIRKVDPDSVPESVKAQAGQGGGQ